MTARRGGVLDETKVAEHSYTGATVELRATQGAVFSRIMHPPRQRIEAHAHDWPVLAIYRLGGYREESDAGESAFDGPSVVFHPGGAAHADEVGELGLETVSLSFDPSWLSPEAAAALASFSWSRVGGAAALAARKLAMMWLTPRIDEQALRRATSKFFLSADAAPAPKQPDWVNDLDGAGVHPAWRARAYRAWRGEGIAETARRRRVERAVQMLRESQDSLAAIAADAGFCDQSHMNRCFNAVLGRTPAVVRSERALLARVA